MTSGNPKKKTTTTKKKTTAKKNERPDNGIYREAALVAAFGLCLLWLISNFGFGGYIGGSISGALFGVFGLLSYILPVAVFLAAAFLVSNPDNSIAYVKAGAGVVSVICLCAFLQLVTVGYDKETKIYEFYQYARDYKTAGGLIGGLVVKGLCPAFGLAGAYVILLLLLVMSALLITERSIFAGLRSGKLLREKKKEERLARAKERGRAKEKEAGKQAAGRADTYSAGRAPDAEAARSGRREGRIIHGVSMDTTLKPLPEPSARTEDKKETALEQEKPAKSGRSRRTAASRAQTAEAAEKIQETVEQNAERSSDGYVFPPITLLRRGDARANGDSGAYLQKMADKLETTLQSFGVGVRVTDVSCGPSVTRYELQPDQGVKVSRIVGLSDDIKLNLAVTDIRIEAPIPGKAAVGIEVPNREKSSVMLRDMLEEPVFQKSRSTLSFAVGRDIAGKTVVGDIQKMPHVLIAGTTGSGKSVFINTIVMSILYKARPDEVKLIMIDPKVVEFKVYNGIPHLMIPVVTDPKKAAGALNWAVMEMNRRYQEFAKYNARDLKGYNAKVDKIKDIEDEDKPQKMPQIVIVVDELADLMMVAANEVEEAICRLAQLARAAGIHLVIATQRPSVDVITGLIKANMPSRIALSVTSGVDSRTILDMNGAEKLLGNGDMLYYPSGCQKPLRIQGGFISDEEVQRVTDFLREHSTQDTDSQTIEKQVESCIGVSARPGADPAEGGERDVYFEKAARLIVEKDKASIGMLQRSFKIGFNRAARIMDQLCEAGVVGEEEGTKPRKVLMSMEQLEQYIDEYI